MTSIMLVIWPLAARTSTTQTSSVLAATPFWCVKILPFSLFLSPTSRSLQATETLASRPAECSAASASAVAASATPSATADSDGDDCEDGADEDSSSAPVPSATPTPTQAPNNVAPSPDVTPSSSHHSSSHTPSSSHAAPAATPSTSPNTDAGSGQQNSGGLSVSSFPDMHLLLNRT